MYWKMLFEAEAILEYSRVLFDRKDARWQHYLNALEDVGKEVFGFKVFEKLHFSALPFGKRLELARGVAEKYPEFRTMPFYHNGIEYSVAEIDALESLRFILSLCQCPCGCQKLVEPMEDLCLFCLEYHEDLRRDFVYAEKYEPLTVKVDKFVGSVAALCELLEALKTSACKIHGDKIVFKCEMEEIEDVREH